MDADRAIRQEHARRAFDAVVGIWATESGWVASRAGRRLGVPVLVHLAGGELTWLPAIRYGNLGRGLAWRLVRAALAKANIVTTPSGPMAGAFSATFPELASRGREWWPGVDTEMFRPSPEARPIGRPLTFVTVGSLVPVKGHRRVLEAFGRLSALEPSLDWRLIVAGDGPLRSDLEASARSLGLGERVEFRGDVPHDGLPDLLRACDCFVIGSFHEAECMAALEAMAAGLPWVAPPLGVFADLNSRSCGDRTGIAFGPESGAFVGALRSFALLSEPERAQMGEAARAAVSSDYEYRRAVGGPSRRVDTPA
jgi:glycosyltransferase involved in cell wall biosynthesis